MCTLAMLSRPGAAHPLVVLANRDEVLSRAFDPPRVWDGRPRLWAGRDRAAGGTWLGVNEHGVVAGLTNRFDPGGADRTRPSRGLLVTAALACPTAEEAAARLSRLSADACNGFNLLIADRRTRWRITNRPSARVESVESPLVVLGNDAADSEDGDKRLLFRRALQPLVEDRHADADALLDAADGLLTRHEGRMEISESGMADFPICVHTPHYGTVTSMVISVGERAADTVGWWTDGPRCRNGWKTDRPFA